jgi:hypothetical protein
MRADGSTPGSSAQKIADGGDSLKSDNKQQQQQPIKTMKVSEIKAELVSTAKMRTPRQTAVSRPSSSCVATTTAMQCC